jgi:hypothetical protein
MQNDITFLNLNTWPEGMTFCKKLPTENLDMTDIQNFRRLLNSFI